MKYCSFVGIRLKLTVFTILFMNCCRLLSLICICLLFSCSMNTKPEAVWLFSHVDGRAKYDTLLNQASFLNLQPDGFYTRDFGFYDEGKWELNNEELVLHSKRRSVARIPVKALQKDELHLNATASLVAKFVRTPALSNDKENPFIPAYNQWRLKAKRKESRDEISKRLLNHCLFWETYFSWGLKQEVNALDVRNTPTPIKIYGNGFGLKKFEELPASWTRYFYDTADCRQATEMLKVIFARRNIKWPRTKNTYEMFVSAFQQLQTQLEEMDVTNEMQMEN